MADESIRLRRRLVEELAKSRAIRTAQVRKAFLKVPRELFIPDIARREGLDAIYKDEVFVTKKDAKGLAVSSSSQPGIMAPMLELLDLRQGHRVLEVGAGTGYNAAMIATIVGRRGRVTAIDIDGAIARQARTALRRGGFSVHVLAGDGRYGARNDGPYDRIIVTASARIIPRAWFEQLVDGGILVVPFRLSPREFQPQGVFALRKSDGGLESIEVIGGGFMGLRGSAQEPAPSETIIDWFSASEYRRRAGRTFCYVNGAPVRRLGSLQRRRLLGAMLSARPRTRTTGKTMTWMGIQTFLTLASPPGGFVTYVREKATGAGILTPTGSGVAAMVVPRGKDPGGTKRRRLSIEAIGSPQAERLMRLLVDEWRELGCPTHEDLAMRVPFDGRSRAAWRSQSRDGQRIEFGWRTATTRRRRGRA